MQHMSSVNCEKQKAKWSYIQSRECRSRAASELAASDGERVPEIHFQNRKTSLQQQNQSTLMTKKKEYIPWQWQGASIWRRGASIWGKPPWGRPASLKPLLLLTLFQEGFSVPSWSFATLLVFKFANEICFYRILMFCKQDQIKDGTSKFEVKFD